MLSLLSFTSKLCIRVGVWAAMPLCAIANPCTDTMFLIALNSYFFTTEVFEPVLRLLPHEFASKSLFITRF